LKTFTEASAKQKPLKGSVNTEMDKALYTLLISFIGFYALLFTSLLMRACAGYLRARRPELPKLEKVSDTWAMAHPDRAWTSAVRRG
jgi:hypothetical protein